MFRIFFGFWIYTGAIVLKNETEIILETEAVSKTQ